MICAWKDLLDILPEWMREKTDRIGRTDLCEIRIRLNAPPELITATNSIWLQRTASQDDIQFVINTASKYSPWTASGSSQGYLTAPGGHRIGLCGESVMKEGTFVGIREIRSLCIRVCRDFPGLAAGIPVKNHNYLILGAPGWGKTTILRDLARTLAEHTTVAVIDERGELFPNGLPTGKRMDILYSCPKAVGIETVLRTMGPQCIVVDEITAPEDCIALEHAIGCGVQLIATAHAASTEDLSRRPVYRPLLDNRVFDRFLCLHSDRTYHLKGACA